MKTLINNIGVLITPKDSNIKYGKEMADLKELNDAYIIIENDVIKEIGTGKAPEDKYDLIHDAKQSLVTPGLVDAHTHLVFGGSREHEFKKKLEGVPYLDILKQGGGILYTVEQTRKASKEELTTKALKFMDYMLKCGVTTVEAKSGYGLDEATEIKQLEVNEILNEKHAIDVVSTFMGAHAVPKDKTIEEYTDEVIAMLPKMKKYSKFCDIFCEDGAFNLVNTKKILEAAKKEGYKLKIHTDEVVPLGGTELAGELKCISAEHLMATDDSGIKALKDNKVIANILPQTTFSLGKSFAPGRKMVDAGCAVAISTDFNPGSCPSPNIQFAMQLGCSGLKLTPKEVLTAVTINAAGAIDLEKNIGSLEVGKKADITIWDAPNLDYILFHFGMTHTRDVFKNGKLVLKEGIII